MSKPVVGITVLPEYVQSETVQGVLDNLERAGVTSITTSPYVMRPGDKSTGGREPPIDAGAGSVRLLDRPLWGHRELWVCTSPSFEPDRSLYSGLRYQPPHPDEFTRRDGPIVLEFIRQAQARGMRVYFQVQAAIPPGYRVQFGGPDEDDRPRLPDGRIPERRVANNGSLASANILAYGDAMIRDLCQQYPELDGMRFDWPEYPPYFLDDAFFDFGTHAQQFAEEVGLPFREMKEAAASLYETLHGKLANDDLHRCMPDTSRAVSLLEWVDSHQYLKQWLDFKATLVERLLVRFRTTMNDAGGSGMEMLPNAFPPPWSYFSGFDFSRVAEQSAGFCVKLYGMHWGMMVRFYADALLAANPGLSEALLIRVITRVLDVAESNETTDSEIWRYPEPNEPHPGSGDAARRKIEAAQKAARDTPVYALAHGYGPVDDFRRRLENVQQASPNGIWLNRYGYLANEKLDVVRSLYT